MGHIAKACKTKQKGRKGNQDPTKSTHFMQEEDSMPENTKHTEQEISHGLFTTQGNSETQFWQKSTSIRYLLKWKLTLVHHYHSSTRLLMT